MAALERILRTGKLPSSLKSVLYLDRHLLVLNKPPGLVSQLGYQGENVKPKDRLDTALSKIRSTLDLQNPLLPIHRLDVATTGCLAIATNEASARSLSKQFVQGEVQKSYLALVRGGEQTFPQKSGRIDAAIQYRDGYFHALHQSGRPSVTEWELVGSSTIAPLSLVRLKLLTGNKHQLRIHMAMKLGAPILGDTRYSKSHIAEEISRKTQLDPDRMFLHAAEISFLRYRQRGGSKRFRLGVRAPLPDDFLKLCKTFKIELPKRSEGGLSVNDEPILDMTIPDLDGYWLPNHAIPASDIEASN